MAVSSLGSVELPQVGILPAHDHLQRVVERRQSDRVRDENAPPDRRRDLRQFDVELRDGGLHELRVALSDLSSFTRIACQRSAFARRSAGQLIEKPLPLLDLGPEMSDLRIGSGTGSPDGLGLGLDETSRIGVVQLPARARVSPPYSA